MLNKYILYVENVFTSQNHQMGQDGIPAARLTRSPSREVIWASLGGEEPEVEVWVGAAGERWSDPPSNIKLGNYG